jgi:hypothetical protein
MTLLEATTTVIDAAKTHSPWETDRMLHHAIKRLEKRLEVLQLRRDKEISRRQDSAWTDCQVVIKNTCSHCGFVFDLDAFLNNAQITGRGHIKRLHCPTCKKLLIGIP